MSKQETEQLARYAESQGWVIDRTTRGHWEFVSPGGEMIRHSGTASDWRAIRNFKSRLRRAGLVVPPKRHKKKERVLPESLEQVSDLIGLGEKEREMVVTDIDPYPYVEEMVSQWRTEDWFDQDGFPLTEDEWGGPDEYSILTAVRMERDQMEDIRSDKTIRMQMAAVKYWGGLNFYTEQYHADGCTCGKEFDQPTVLVSHVVRELEAGRPGHAPTHQGQVLRTWTDPYEVIAALEMDDSEDLEAQLQVARNQVADLEVELEAEISRRELLQGTLKGVATVVNDALADLEVSP